MPIREPQAPRQGPRECPECGTECANARGTAEIIKRDPDGALVTKWVYRYECPGCSGRFKRIGKALIPADFTHMLAGNTVPELEKLLDRRYEVRVYGGEGRLPDVGEMPKPTRLTVVLQNGIVTAVRCIG